MLISFILAVLVVIFDQLTKVLIYGTPAKSIIGNLLWFQSTFNTGVAFSMFENMTIVFSVVSFVASGIFIYFIISNKVLKYKAEKIAIGAILGGTVGNLIDRVFLSGVRDFIYLKFMNFAIFNIADMAVSLGAVAFCIIMIIYEFKNSKTTQKNANNDIQQQKKQEITDNEGEK